MSADCDFVDKTKSIVFVLNKADDDNNDLQLYREVKLGVGVGGWVYEEMVGIQIFVLNII